VSRPPAAEGARPPVAEVVRLLVIVKEPVAGRVKTRLTPRYRPAEAAAIAAAAIDDTLAAVAALLRLPGGDVVRPVLVLDGTVGGWLVPPPDLAGRLEVVPQVAGPFDVRLAAAFEAAGLGPALLIGMDTPQATPELLAAALRGLRAADAVFGPAADGGWWALGLSRPDGALLRGVPTSRPDTGARQLARLAAAGLRVRMLPTLRDVDTPADADTVADLVPDGRFATLIRGLRAPSSAATRDAGPARGTGAVHAQRAGEPERSAPTAGAPGPRR
jgi:hypothetical protein